MGRGGLAVAVVGLNPLVIVKADRPKSESRDEEGDEKHNFGSEKGGSLRSLRSLGSLANDRSDLDNSKISSKVRLSDPNDLGDHRKNDAATAIIDEKVIEAFMQKAIGDKDHFTEDDFIYAAYMTPNV